LSEIHVVSLDLRELSLGIKFRCNTLLVQIGSYFFPFSKPWNHSTPSSSSKLVNLIFSHCSFPSTQLKHFSPCPLHSLTTILTQVQNDCGCITIQSWAWRELQCHHIYRGCSSWFHVFMMSLPTCYQVLCLLAVTSSYSLNPSLSSLAP